MFTLATDLAIYLQAFHLHLISVFMNKKKDVYFFFKHILSVKHDKNITTVDLKSQVGVHLSLLLGFFFFRLYQKT